MAWALPVGAPRCVSSVRLGARALTPFSLVGSWLPILKAAGARLTVTLLSGHDRPLERTAARTRSRASRTAASGNPTIVKPGSPLETWTSTETARPTAPLSVAEATAASTRGNGRTRGRPGTCRLRCRPDLAVLGRQVLVGPGVPYRLRMILLQLWPGSPRSNLMSIDRHSAGNWRNPTVAHLNVELHDGCGEPRNHKVPDRHRPSRQASRPKQRTPRPERHCPSASGRSRSERSLRPAVRSQR